MYFRAVGEVHDQVHGGTSDAKVFKAVSQLGGAGDGHNDGSGPAHGRARDGEAATGHGDDLCLCRGGDGSHCPASPPQVLGSSPPPSAQPKSAGLKMKT